MPLFGWRLTDAPDYFAVVNCVEDAITQVIRGQMPSLQKRDWACPINKNRPEGLGLEDAWSKLVKQVVEARLYKNPTFGKTFRRWPLTESYIDSSKKLTLNDLERDLINVGMGGKPRGQDQIV